MPTTDLNITGLGNGGENALSGAPTGLKTFMIKAEISFSDRPPIKTHISVREENDEKAIDKACEQLKKQHPKVKSMILSTQAARISYKKETKGWAKKKL